MRVGFAHRARSDLQAIADFIAIGNPVRAESFVVELGKACIAIGDRPRAYPIKRGLPDELRVRYFRNYAILYRIAEKEVLVVRVVHAARDLEALMDDEASL
jgi:toxin ParE1/3/4